MIAYYVHNPAKEDDRIVIPELGCTVAVSTQIMNHFIGVSPRFNEWSGEACTDLRPEDFGTVIATRDEAGDVCVSESDLWQERMNKYLSGG